MQGSLKDKMQQLEVAPPPAVWDKISSALDDEFVAADGVIAAKLADAEIPAPQGIWEAISEQLNDDVPATTTKVRRLTFWKVAAAAALVGLIAVAALYLFNDTAETSPQIVSTASVPRTVDSQRTQTPAPTTRIEQRDTERVVSRPPSNNSQIRNNRTFQSAFAVNSASENTQIDPTVSPEQAPIYELTTVSSLQPVSISAPPIRDNNGKVILDLATISHAGDPYITVTGPNGTQTKISSKFLSCLSYMNANLSSADMDANAVGCMLQFDEWRKRLLTEPAFVPAANNFFDIFELKDMLQEM